MKILTVSHTHTNCLWTLFYNLCDLLHFDLPLRLLCRGRILIYRKTDARVLLGGLNGLECMGFLLFFHFLHNNCDG